MDKRAIVKKFRRHVSSGKVAFFEKYGLDFVMGRREGIRMWDIDGKKSLINLHCNGGVFNLGHRHPLIVDTLRQALDHYDIGNHHFISSPRAAAAEMLARLMPGDLDYTIFGVSGGEAVDTAIKIARAYTGRQTIISAKGGYHGHTGYALATGDEKYRNPFGPQLPGFVQCAFADADALAAIMGPDTAAVLLETVPATLGMPIPPPDYLPAVRRLCNQHGALLILDEVQCGLGRTGKLWAFEHFDVLPDMVVLGKGLSGGVYPITATVLRRPLEAIFHPDPFIHVSTFGGAELGCIIMQKVLEIASSRTFLDHVQYIAGYLEAHLKNLQKKHASFFKGIRQLGLMIGLELEDENCGPLLTKTAYDNGLLIIYANNDKRICQFLPPLTITEQEVDQIIPKLDKAFSQARKLRLVLAAKNIIGKFITGR